MKTITYDESKWQLVPKEITPPMIHEAYYPGINYNEKWKRILDVAPTPPLNTQDGVDEDERESLLVSSAKLLERIDSERYCIPEKAFGGGDPGELAKAIRSNLSKNTPSQPTE